MSIAMHPKPQMNRRVSEPLRSNSKKRRTRRPLTFHRRLEPTLLLKPMQKHQELRRGETLTKSHSRSVGRKDGFGRVDELEDDLSNEFPLGSLSVEKGDNSREMFLDFGLEEDITEARGQLGRRKKGGGRRERTHLVQLRNDGQNEPRIQIPLRHQTLHERNQRNRKLDSGCIGILGFREDLKRSKSEGVRSWREGSKEGEEFPVVGTEGFDERSEDLLEGFLDGGAEGSVGGEDPAREEEAKKERTGTRKSATGRRDETKLESSPISRTSEVERKRRRLTHQGTRESSSSKRTSTPRAASPPPAR